MKNIHQNLASGKWNKLSLIEQLANIGSEVQRVIYWHELDDKENKNYAIWRVLELFDLTISDQRWKFRVSELTRLKEVFCNIFFKDNEYNILFDSLSDYFLSFAMAARK